MRACHRPVETIPLLEDLLEDSARIYHRHCAVIQRVFHERWLELVGEGVGQAQIECPDANPALVDAHVRDRLRPCRLALREKQDWLIQEERDQRALRDAAVRAYVASLHASQETPAAA